MTTNKNRNRSQYTFANINLLGKCNADCFFCLGLDLETKFKEFNHIGTHFAKWKNFERFLVTCQTENIRQLYITGQNTDPLVYKYIDELIIYLQSKGFYVGMRTNGILAEKKMDTINRCNTCMGDAIGYSIHARDVAIQAKILRVDVNRVPNWDAVLKKTTAPLRVSLVVNRYNRNEIISTIKWLGKNHPNVRYAQIRKVSTDTRYDTYKPDMDAYEDLYVNISTFMEKVAEYETADIYMIGGLSTSLWKTVGTTANSINYFTDGTISDNYFIVEGYCKENNIELGSKEFLGSGSWKK